MDWRVSIYRSRIKFVLIAILFLGFLPDLLMGHGGGLDQRGGHNCYVGSCAGSYHFHRPQSDNTDNSSNLFGWLIVALMVGSILYPFAKGLIKKTFPFLRSPEEKRYWAAYDAKDNLAQGINESDEEFDKRVASVVHEYYESLDALHRWEALSAAEKKRLRDR